ncbi:MAG: V-type ATP synthase subunit D [Clostridiales bacterium]|jgi:V/A-type H+-transporting ATPase subunit D|nr:V-type ATP synthase subunit D [Clostridiales bacterium]
MEFKPTRMELTNLKKRKAVAVRGHKMMKDKRDELVRRFIVYVRRNRELREEMERKLGEALKAFVLARASMGGEAIEEALMYPARAAQVAIGMEHVLSIQVPRLTIEESGEFQYPYGFATTSAELDGAVRALGEILPMLLELAQVEKTCNRLADEIEKTRRRVNALEYVMIPQFIEGIRQIKMKLDENERGNLTRLMKTKDMLAKKGN